MIQALRRHGVYVVDIAAELGVHPKTVRRALKRGSEPAGRRRRRGSKLDPFTWKVDELLREQVWNAQVILREIQALGYTGKATILRAYIQPKRELRARKATVRFETEPGQQLQSDWGQKVAEIDGMPIKVHFSINNLGNSRRFHVFAALCEDAEHTYEGVIAALEHFGGVPKQELFDNQGPIVLEDRPPSAARFHPRALDLAEHYGFELRACRPYRGRTKGKTERIVGYVKQHFFAHYHSFDSLAHLQQLLEQWLKEEADQRVHGTHKEIVAVRFEKERPHLLPLPATRWDSSYHELRQVAWDGYIDVRGNRYPVPLELCGKSVSARISLAGQLRIYHQDVLVIQHTLKPKAQGWATTPAAPRALWESLHAEPVAMRPLSVYEEVASCSSTAC